MLLHPLFRFNFSGYLLLSLLFLRYHCTWGDEILEVTDGLKSREPDLCPLTLPNPDRKAFEHLHGFSHKPYTLALKKKPRNVEGSVLFAGAAQSQNSLFKIFLFSGLQCLACSLAVAVEICSLCTL